MNHERLARGSGLDTLLHHLKLNINDPAQFLVAQRFEDYDLVQTVDELRRELSAGGLNSGARDSGAEPHRAIVARGTAKSQPWSNQGTHFCRAEITGQEDHRRREVHLAVITQGQ